MMKVSVNPQELARLGQRLRDYAAVTKQTASDCAKEQAALICQDMAVFTPPLVAGGGQGLSKGAEKAGNNAVAGDIRKMFIAVGDKNINSQRAIMMMNMADATRNGNIGMFNQVVAKAQVDVMRGMSPVMRKILNDPDQDRAFKKAKNYLHRIPVKTNEYGLSFEHDLRSKHNAIKAKFGGRIKKGQKLGVPRMLVESKQVLDEYIKERQMMVGRIKSGWLTTLRQIPPPIINGIPKNFGSKLANAPGFIQRHSSPNGYVQIGNTTTEFKITIGNRQGNVNEIAMEANALSLAIANREKMMGLRIKRFLDAAAKKSNAARK